MTILTAQGGAIHHTLAQAVNNRAGFIVSIVALTMVIIGIMIAALRILSRTKSKQLDDNSKEIHDKREEANL